MVKSNVIVYGQFSYTPNTAQSGQIIQASDAYMYLNMEKRKHIQHILKTAHSENICGQVQKVRIFALNSISSLEFTFINKMFDILKSQLFPFIFRIWWVNSPCSFLDQSKTRSTCSYVFLHLLQDLASVEYSWIPPFFWIPGKI